MKNIKLICRLNKDWQPENIKIKKAGGQTNRNFIVEYKRKKFFVRLPWERADIVDRKVEAKNIFVLSRNKNLRKILPKYYIYIFQKRNILQLKNKGFFDLPDGTMLTEYIDGKLFTLPLFKEKIYQEKLAKMFYTFHTSRVKFKNEYNVFRDEIEKYRLAAQKYPIHQVVDRKTIRNLEKLEKEAQREIFSLKRGVSTHNDFIFQNFLIGKNGRIYLLDFEYAGLNKKGGIFYDYGFLFADNLFRNPPLTLELFEKFLKVSERIYKKPFDLKQIYWSAIAATLVQFWWGILRYFSVKSEKEKKYFKNYILKRTRGIKFIYDLLKKG